MGMYVVDQRVAKRRVVKEPEAQYAPGIARGEMGLSGGDPGVAWQQQQGMPMMIPSLRDRPGLHVYLPRIQHYASYRSTVMLFRGPTGC